jgi:hypothetical protein
MPRKRLGERMYSSYSFSTSALDGGEWSASRPGSRFTPGKGPPVHIVHEAEWAPEPVWTQRLKEKFFRLCRGSNLDRPIVQPVVRHYTDWAARLTGRCLGLLNSLHYSFPHKNFVCSCHVFHATSRSYNTAMLSLITWWMAQTMKLLFMQFPPCAGSFCYLESKYSSVPCVQGH